MASRRQEPEGHDANMQLVTVDPSKASALQGIAEELKRPKSRTAKAWIAVGAAMGLAFVVATAFAAVGLEHWFHHEHPSDASPESDVPSLATQWNEGCCRFAPLYNGSNWRDPQIQRSFVENALAAERHFFAAPSIAFDAETGMTYDGRDLDIETLEPTTIRPASAPSKESIQLSLLALSLQTTEEAGEWLAHFQPLVYSQKEALDLLEKKVSTMEDFDRRYPAFGGFLPWFCARGALEDGRCRGLNDPAGGLEPTYDFHDSMPGLDNGQMAWAIVALVHVLKKKATADSTGRISSLAERWEQRLLRMQATAVNLFYNGNGSGTVRALTWLRNRSVDATDPTNSWTYSSYVLDDAFEGEMMGLFMDLLGNWSGYGSTKRLKSKQQHSTCPAARILQSRKDFGSLRMSNGRLCRCRTWRCHMSESSSLTENLRG